MAMTLTELKHRVDELHDKYSHLSDLVQTDIADLSALQPSPIGQPVAILTEFDEKTRYVLTGSMRNLI